MASPSPTPPTRRLQSLQLGRSPSSSPPARNREPDATDSADDASNSPTLPPYTQNQDSIPAPTEEQRTAALQRELHLLRSMNTTLTNLHHTLTVSGDNLTTLRTTIGSSAVLLDTWTRILSQAEHNARLIADPSWEGATDDAVLAEREEVERKARLEREREEREQRERERTIRAATPTEKTTVPGGSRLGMGRGLRGSTGSRRAASSIGRRGSIRGRGRA